MDIKFDNRVIVFFDEQVYIAVDLDNYIVVQHNESADTAYEKLKYHLCSNIALSKQHPDHETLFNNPRGRRNAPQNLMDKWPSTNHYPIEKFEYQDYIFRITRADV